MSMPSASSWLESRDFTLICSFCMGCRSFSYTFLYLEHSWSTIATNDQLLPKILHCELNLLSGFSSIGENSAFMVIFSLFGKYSD